MKISNFVKGAAMGASLAAFVGFTVPAATASAAQMLESEALLHGYQAQAVGVPVGDQDKGKKEGKCGEGKCAADKKKDSKKKKDGEAACGSQDKKDKGKKEGKCGEGKCG